MKTKVSFFTKVLAVAVVAVMTSFTVFADGEITDVYTTGSTDTPAGDYVVRTTNDVFYFNGEKYDVYKVYYDDPAMNMKIAVNTDGKCKSFVAYSSDYTLFYSCTKDGFGVRKVMFANPDAHKKFDVLEYKEQTVIKKDKKIEQKDAIETIATKLPSMHSA